MPLFKKKRSQASGVARKRARKLMTTADATLLADGDSSQTLAAQTLSGEQRFFKTNNPSKYKNNINNNKTS